MNHPPCPPDTITLDTWDNDGAGRAIIHGTCHDCGTQHVGTARIYDPHTVQDLEWST